MDELHDYCYIVSRLDPFVMPSLGPETYVNVYLPSSIESDSVISREYVVLAYTGVLESDGIRDSGGLV